MTQPIEGSEHEIKAFVHEPRVVQYTIGITAAGRIGVVIERSPRIPRLSL